MIRKGKRCVSCECLVGSKNDQSVGLCVQMEISEPEEVRNLVPDLRPVTGLADSIGDSNGI